MKLAVVVLASLLLALGGWSALAPESPGVASTGTTIYMPVLIKQAWLELVSIVQRDGHQAVYWPSPLPPGPYYPAPTPTPSTGGVLVSTFPLYLEVENHTIRNITGVTVELRTADSSGVPITQTVAGTLVDILKPGQKSPVAFNVPFPGDYKAFQAATKELTLLPTWGYTDWDSQANLEVRWSPPWGPSPSFPTPGPSVPALPNVSGWVRNTGTAPASGVSVVVSIRGNDQASGLVLEATKVPIYYPIYPGSTANFYASFNRDYGSLAGYVEAVAQRRADIPGILGVASW